MRGLFSRARSGIPYWEQRARTYGVRSVLNLGHGEGELEEVTRRQMAILFPVLQRALRGNETLILDFGCGTGRFTPSLARLIDGRAIGVDPIARLLALAPRAENVEYRLMRGRRIPLDDGVAEVVWVGLVLGTIVRERDLGVAAEEITRVLAPGALLFLIENTEPKRDLAHFRFRSVEAYRKLFPEVELELAGSYEDLGELISILAGRKRQ